MGFLINPYAFETEGPALDLDPLAANVQSLLRFEGADGSTTFTDDRVGTTWSLTDTADISSDQARYGSTSGDFQGNGFIQTNGSEVDFQINDDMCIELWYYPTVLTGLASIITHRFGALGSLLGLYLYVNGASGGIQSNVVGTLVNPVTLVLNTWHHIALVRGPGTAAKLYVDGVLHRTGTIGTNTGLCTWRIGFDASVTGAGARGYIDGFRFTNGVMRYTEPFTPPTELLPIV